jgi:Tfp pilus assembly protein PilX
MAKQLIGPHRNQQGFSLIIVIFSMMLLAILGWAMFNFLGGDLEMGIRSFDSERAFYLAESGREWALMQIMSNSSWNTSTDRDCNHTNEWITHNLTGGQYKVCCRGNQSSEDATAVLEIAGYAPSAANYLAMRKTKVLVKLGAMSAVIQAKNLFNWSNTNSGTSIRGDIVAGQYEGDDTDSIVNEADDLAVPPSNSGTRTFYVNGTFPQIDMDYFLNNATYVWDLSRESNITRINGNRITVADPIFTAGYTWSGEVAVRNLFIGGWDEITWREIDTRINSTSVSLVNSAPSSWLVGERIRTCRRFDREPSNGGIKYIHGDALIDVRAGDFRPDNGVNLIAEGDIVIKGGGTVSMTGQTGTTAEPCLATQNGNILSPDLPDGNNANQHLRNRNFAGIIYTENGDVRFNCLNTNNATLGNNIILEGDVNIQNQTQGRWGWGRGGGGGWRGWRGWWRRWGRQASASGGFDLEPVIIQWKEQ